MKRLLLLLLCCATSLADDAAKPQWEKNAELAVLLTSGNTEVSTIGLGVGALYRPDPWTFKARGNYLSNTSSGTKTAELYSAELRGERSFTQALSGFLSTLYLKNRFAGFNDRFGAEAGVSYLLLSAGEHTLGAELGAGVLSENRTDATNNTFGTVRAGLEYHWKLSPTAEFSNKFSVLEDLKTSRDWRLSDVAAITAVLTELFSLKVSFQVDHLNLPVTGKKSTDTATTVALVAKF